MNPLYHEFTIGFNWWYVLAPALTVPAFLVGWLIPGVKRDEHGKMRLRTYVKNRFAVIFIVTPLAGVFSWRALVESGAGIVQYLDNGLMRYESGVYSVLGLIMVVTGITVAAGALYFFAYCLGRYVKIRWLCRKYNLKLRSRKK